MMIEPVDTTPTVDQSLAESLGAAREAYRSEISLARGGAHAAFDYSTLLDLLLVRIHAEAASQTETAVALIAIGGYGRQQLCLYSDIDLLILFGGPIAAPEERFVKALLHPLWDLGLDIGHPAVDEPVGQVSSPPDHRVPDRHRRGHRRKTPWHGHARAWRSTCDTTDIPCPPDDDREA